MSVRVFITGICGFVGSTIAKLAVKRALNWTISGCDNFSRPGSTDNWQQLKRLGVNVFAADLRQSNDLDGIDDVDWVIDCAANPSVLSGVDGKTSSRQVMDHNLLGTLNVLELVRQRRCGLILISTSRVYSLNALASIQCRPSRDAFVPVPNQPITGLNESGIDESFSTAPPISLYGASKLTSELLALEYASSFDFPLRINRCGLLAGAGQFGKADQGIVAYWIHSYFRKRPLKYIGFGGEGLQVRDCLHPADLLCLIEKQMRAGGDPKIPQVLNVSGGSASAFSLKQMTQWCRERFRDQVTSDCSDYRIGNEPENRKFDVPWLVLDSQKAETHWDWKPERSTQSIFEEIAQHAEMHPHWGDY